MKSELRKQVLHEMKDLPREQKQAMDQALTDQFLEHPFYQEAKIIATYLSFPHEFQTQELIEQALKDGKKVLIPKTYPKGRMDFVVVITSTISNPISFRPKNQARNMNQINLRGIHHFQISLWFQ